MMNRTQFAAAIAVLPGVDALSSVQVDRLVEHYGLLSKWNPRLNLVSEASLGEAAVRHYGESLFLAAALPQGVASVADVGSGAGFPGYPLAVVRPEVAVTLIESDQRKAAFLREVSDSVPNLAIHAVRSEVFRAPVEVLVSRAVRWQACAKLAEVLTSVRLVMLLCGEAEYKAVRVGVRQLALEVRPLPWAPGRVLAVFHVEQ